MSRATAEGVPVFQRNIRNSGKLNHLLCSWSLQPGDSWQGIGQIRRRKVGGKYAQIDPQLITVSFRIKSWLQEGQNTGLHGQIKVVFGYESPGGHIKVNPHFSNAVVQIAAKKGAA